MEKHSLLDAESIQAWIADNEPGGHEKLWHALEAGDIRGRRATTVRLWFAQNQAQAQAARQMAEDALARRNVEAAERSAKATQEAADHAKSAAIWAKWSMLIATAALIVSAWPMVKDIGR